MKFTPPQKCFRNRPGYKQTRGESIYKIHNIMTESCLFINEGFHILDVYYIPSSILGSDWLCTSIFHYLIRSENDSDDF